MLTRPDIQRYHHGNTGVPFVWTYRASAPGPHVMLAAIVHGNEPCGAAALDRLLRLGVRPRLGRLTLAFANIAAYARFDPADPARARHVDEDLNRVWDAATLDGRRDSTELRRARALRPIVDDADLLLDLHSMHHDTAPLTLAGPLARGRALAEALGAPGCIVSDFGHRAGTRLRDYGGFGEPASHKTALLVECGQHLHRHAADMAYDVAARFLVHLGIVGAGALALSPRRARAAQRHIEVTEAVTINSPGFRFVRQFQGLEVIARAGTIIAHDGDEPVVTPYDRCVLVMPARRTAPGVTAVRLGRYSDESMSAGGRGARGKGGRGDEEEAEVAD